MSSAKDQSQVASAFDHDEEMSPEMRKASIHAPRDMPASLRGLSEKEVEKIGLKATLKIDAIVMPCLVVMYVLNYLDRQNIASARLAGLPEDLNLSQTQYKTCVSILFVGYSESTPLTYQVNTLLTVGSLDASSFEHGTRTDQMAWRLHQCRNGDVGCCLIVHGCCA
jgi:hypothetical protein